MNQEIKQLIPNNQYEYYRHLLHFLRTHYHMEETLRPIASKTRPWVIEHKFTRSKKTLTGFYFYQDCGAIQLIFGLKEREQFELKRTLFSHPFQQIYDHAKTYHDGKWMMIPLDESVSLDEIKQLLIIKRKPNK